MLKGYESYKHLKLERRGRILVITIDNPPSNAVAKEFHGEFARIFYDINNDEETAVVLLTGAGDKAFSAGGDVKRMARQRSELDTKRWTSNHQEAKHVFQGALKLEKPLVVRVNGHAMGLGATLVALADISVMVDTAKIADTHVKVGLTAGDGCAMLWPLLMGLTRARRYMLTGDPITGKEAAEMGLVTEAVPRADLDRVAYGWAERLANGPGVALNTTKIAINMMLTRMFDGMIETHLGLQTRSWMSEDHLEGTRAFSEKREPRFTGK
jgi:enoyl-CoA hydratase